MLRKIILASILGIGLVAPPATAQMSVWLGGGRVLNESSQLGAAVQVGVPVVPFAFRGEALMTDPFSGDRTANLLGGLVYTPFALPVVQPYLIGGVGRYDIGGSDPETGGNYGVGVRVGVMHAGAFAEVRRHVPLSATLASVGLAF